MKKTHQNQVDPQKEEEILAESEVGEVVESEEIAAAEDQLAAKFEKELAQAKNAAQSALESERRAVADYQNLHRRTQEDRSKLIKLAARNVIESILQPLEHLYLAKEQLKDPGLNMVYQQFQQALQVEGLEEIQVMGKEFDSQIMEVVDKQQIEDKKQIDRVVKVLQRGYTLNGEVIQHAKVVIGISEK